MRYSFHGKKRSTGETVDGYVEAANSTEAIDRLADQGIIGVYTVRPDPLPAQNSIVVGPGQATNLAPSPEIVLTQLVDKLVSLVGQVEKLLSRPMAAGPTRGESFGKIKRSSSANDVQNAALRDIFQTNMDLRRSLEKLAAVTNSLRPPEAAKEAPPRDQIMGPREPSSPRDRALQAQPAA